MHTQLAVVMSHYMSNRIHVALYVVTLSNSADLTFSLTLYIMIHVLLHVQYVAR